MPCSLSSKKHNHRKKKKMDMEDGEMQMKNRSRALFRAFQFLSISLLSLLVPLSFLFLSRFSLFNYHLLTISKPTATGFSHNLFSINHLLYDINAGVLYAIMSSITVATLIFTLCGKTEYSVLRSRLCICWTLLFAVQACIDLGTRGSMLVNLETRSFLESHEMWVWVRVLFFLGLHEVMLMWFRGVVKPVVDDTIFRVYTEERWPERAVVAATFAAMWWWRLRSEAEGLAAVAELKHKLNIGLEALDYVNWSMYYLCVAIGIVKVLRGCLSGMEMLLLVKNRTRKCCESNV